MATITNRFCSFSFGEHSFGWCWTVATLRIWVFRKWRSGRYEFGAALWIAHHRKTCVRIFGGETETMWLIATTGTQFQSRRCRFAVLFIVVGQYRGCRFQMFLFLFAARYRHPFVDFHCCITNRNPFFLPAKFGFILIKQTKNNNMEDKKKNNHRMCNSYQCRTLSTACITRLISSLARLRVSARTDLDIFESQVCRMIVFYSYHDSKFAFTLNVTTTIRNWIYLGNLTQLNCFQRPSVNRNEKIKTNRFHNIIDDSFWREMTFNGGEKKKKKK